RGLTAIKVEHGADRIGALAAGHSTAEELHLLAKLVRGLGSENIDHRLRHADFSAPAGPGEARWLGTSIASLSTLQRALVVGSFLRKDHPLLAQRLRQAARKGAQIHSLHAVRDDWLIPLAGHVEAAPSQWLTVLTEIAAGVASARGTASPFGGEAGDATRAIVESLFGGERKAILLGNAAAQHPQAGALLAVANWIGEATGASVGYLGESANGVGAQLVGATPGQGGMSAAQMLGAAPGPGLKACLLLNLEPALDAADGQAATAALAGADMVVALTCYRSAAESVADVMLPISPFTETSGTFVNAEGRVQGFHGVVKPLGETRPAWKVLRVLGNLLALDGFGHESSEQVRDEALGAPVGLSERIAARLSNRTGASIAALATTSAGSGLERIADVPIYATDPMVRRSAPLQATADAQAPAVGLGAQLWADLGLAAGARVRVRQGDASAVLPARLDPGMARNVVRIVAGHPHTAGLGAMFGAVSVEKA
ncbi:MAG: molybdopterin-dependent oxidoreductase, partial [Burkholderiaceae bacterium]